MFTCLTTVHIDNDHSSAQLPETIAMEVIISNRFYNDSSDGNANCDEVFDSLMKFLMINYHDH